MFVSKLLSLAAVASVLSVAQTSVSANLIINGDFQTGQLSPSTTAYAQSGTMIPESTWNIVSFDTLHPSWADFNDHTLGNAQGKYMVVNGTDGSPGQAWRQLVEVAPNTEYELSGWFASLFPTSVASLEFRVFATSQESYIATGSFVAPTSLGQWQQHSLTFNSGSADFIAVEIWDTNGAFTGNDYAVDDIALRAAAVPEPMRFAAALPALGLLSRRRRS